MELCDLVWRQPLMRSFKGDVVKGQIIKPVGKLADRFDITGFDANASTSAVSLMPCALAT